MQLTITDDSRKVVKGGTFVAIKGVHSDGNNFIPQAIKNGAAVIVSEEPSNKVLSGNVKYLKVKNARQTFADLVAKEFGNPSKKLKIIGVTGTDGKTTTANIIYWILKTAGKKVGLISTVSAKIGNKEYNTGFHVTNPEPLVLHRFLRKMVDCGCEYAVLEVTSHGLDQERVFGINFEISVLTNITHEHIDYHKTFEAYMKAKAKLFNNSKVAILNKDDKSYKNFLSFIKTSNKILYGKDTLGDNLKREVENRFEEEYNFYNATAAISVAKLLKISEAKILEGIGSFPGVEGRMQEIKNKTGIKIYIDFAHTPNSLLNVLKSLRTKKNGKLIVVYGCAGERDIKKRKIMPKISIKNADISVFTAEDPRSENVEDILDIMVRAAYKSGGNEGENFYRIPERGEAISFAINKIANKGDTVVICGKGHEKSMAYNGVELPWSDQDAVLASISRVAVLGLGVEGRDLINYLAKQGFYITVFDQKPIQQLDTRGLPQNLNFVCGEDYLKSGLNSFDIIFRSPGIYRYIPALIAAEKKGVKISSSIKLFLEKCPAKIIGVTGTKGKGTTSTLIYEILKASGKDVYLAGNIGKPTLELLNHLSDKSWVVLELSSFQLIDVEVSPHIAVVLNITTDHMDWHKDREEYVDAKANIVNHQNIFDFAVINADYKDSKSFSKKTKGKKFYFSKTKKLTGSYVKNRKIFLSTFGKQVLIGDVDSLLLRGEHNWENITSAICASALAGANMASVKSVIYSFRGLEHRLEFVGDKFGVSFYNDSFATGPQPTIAAINSFSEPLTIVLGGYDKGLEYRELVKKLVTRKQETNIVLIGDISDKIDKEIEKTNFVWQKINLGKTSMKIIVKECVKLTPKGGVILFSPAAASFDMFVDYKDRGNQFIKTVKNL